MDNLNSLVMVYQNWPSDARTGVVLYEHLADFYDLEATILEENVDKFEVEGFFESNGEE